MKSGAIKIITTDDGSQSLYLPHLNETYHSTHGAFQESRHVFIVNGLKYFHLNSPATGIKIFEVGFGTGLNALLTYAFAIENPQLSISYETIEAYPIDQSVFQKLNYEFFLPNTKTQFLAMHQAQWHQKIPLSENFQFLKKQVLIDAYDAEPESNNIIYFDAFAPSKQLEMWSPAILKKMFTSLKEKGILVTYCAQGQFKRTLHEIGFHVETLPGPPGKKEMVRATKL